MWENRRTQKRNIREIKDHPATNGRTLKITRIKAIIGKSNCIAEDQDIKNKQ